MTERIPITTQGAEQLKKELERLLKHERPAIQRLIAEAREHGDLKENAEYHAAKEKQSLNEARIQELQGKIPLLDVIVGKTGPAEKVIFGTEVEVLDVDSDEAHRYQIVGEDESDVSHNKISFRTPIGRALIGKKAGDVVEINVPRGKMSLEVLNICHPE